MFAGARAKADGSLTIDPKRGIYAAEVGGEAFAGVKAGVSGEVNLGKYGGVGGRAEAWAGVGAQFRAKVGYKDGKFQARVDIGAALGIGFKLGFNINIDVKGLVDKAKDPIAKPIEAIKNVGQQDRKRDQEAQVLVSGPHEPQPAGPPPQGRRSSTAPARRLTGA